MLGGRYRVLDRLGSGGMAEVFSARDQVLDRLVAVKVFRAEHVARGDTHGVERQQLEMAALARLNHPNLIALYDGSIGHGDEAGASGAGGHAYIVMELIDGPSLAARIAQGALPEASVREIGIQLADGLAYVHAQGMVHRDVKPENILLGVDRSDDDSTVRARLSDFGIVRLLGSERLTSADLTLGTASYLAPEQARGSQVDPPADIYSLGLVLLEALTGRKEFQGPPLEAALARLSQRPQIPVGLPEPWPGLLHAMTETDPRLRPSAAEVARALRNEGSRAMPLVPIAVPVAAGFADAPTGMLPAAATAAAAGAAAVGVTPGPAAGVGAPPAGAPRRRRRLSPAVIAAALSLLVIVTTVGIFLATGNDAKSPAQAPAGNTPSTQQTHRPHTAAKHHRSGAPLAAPTDGGGSGPATHSTSHSAGHSASSSSAPSTHPPTRSAPSTSHSTTAPSTSGAPTSAPPSSRSTSPSQPATSHTTTGSTSAPPTATSGAATTQAAAGSSTPA